MRRLIFAAFFATAIVFPSSTYGHEFCSPRGSNCCCEWKHDISLTNADKKTAKNGVCCENKTTQPAQKYCSGDKRLERAPDGHTFHSVCVCNQK